jgi:A-factor type gamma-butyrolactone 1'-reductase (1S-forming)
LETPDLKFAGKLALIAGGTRGIGAATAKRVAELGADVVITGRRGREGRRLVDEINRNGGSADFIQADLTQPDQVRLVVPFTLKAFGRLDYAFNNAGIPGNNRALVDQTEENFDRVFAVNVKALLLLLQDELKQMIVQREGGSIVNTASVGVCPTQPPLSRAPFVGHRSHLWRPSQRSQERRNLNSHQRKMATRSEWPFSL